MFTYCYKYMCAAIHIAITSRRSKRSVFNSGGMHSSDETYRDCSNLEPGYRRWTL